MLKVYLAGEIHSNWREEIIQLCEKEKLEIEFSSPVTDHEASDNCGVEILGAEEKNFWKDRKGANINSIRTKKSIQDCDVIIVKFGEKYKQWNAAFEGRTEVQEDDIARVISCSLRHRLRKDPLEQVDSGERVIQAFCKVFDLDEKENLSKFQLSAEA